jgi:hypothetical protein
MMGMRARGMYGTLRLLEKRVHIYIRQRDNYHDEVVGWRWRRRRRDGVERVVTKVTNKVFCWRGEKKREEYSSRSLLRRIR